MARVPFNEVYLTGRELEYIQQVLTSGQLAGDGPFTKRSERQLEILTGASKALLTHSCTGALEMAAILCDLKAGDEVIMPSFTFVSTANAFALRGAVPVFVDIRPDTLNLDEELVESAITKRTKAIIPVHYAGISCEMDRILQVAEQSQLTVVEDAAQGINARYKGRALGSIGHLGALSFHATKNIVAGEAGALLLNRAQYIGAAETVREKGTDRSRFVRGEVDKYTWQRLGSSFLPNEFAAATLCAQLEEVDFVTSLRMESWNAYHEAFEDLEHAEHLYRPTVPDDCEHNAHIYYLVLPSLEAREKLRNHLADEGVTAVTHYTALHLAPGGRRYGRSAGELPVTERVVDCVLRLPLFAGLRQDDREKVISLVRQYAGL